MSDKSLYPVPENIESGHLDVGDGHKIYYEVSGNPHGYPVVYLHGGPGGGISGAEHRFFDPDFYKIVIFDQRGAGRSTPYAERKDNTPEDLVSDLEKLRKHLKINTWSIAGGSWGSCLALLYTLKHIKRVNRLLLRGVFFGDLKGAKHIIEENGAATIQPKYFYQYAQAPYVPEEARKNLTQMYHDIFEYADEKTQIDAAMRFDIWDTSIAYPQPNEKAIQGIKRNPKKSLALTKLFFHFVVNSFAKHNYKQHIFSNIHLLENLPIDIIHGECDWICPVENAYELKRACPHANLNIILAGGHTMADPLIRDAFISRLEMWKDE